MGPKPFLAGIDVPFGIGVPSDIQPVAGPLFAVVGRGEQLLDQSFIGITCIRVDKPVDLLRGRRQPGYQVTGPADQRPPVGRRRGGKFVVVRGGQDKGVDGGTHPCGAGNRRQDGFHDGLKRPVPPRLLGR